MEIDQHISKGKRIRKIILFALFICIITLPLLEYGLNVSNEYENTENRNKATLPKFTISNIDSFPNRFDEYFSDNHNFRGDLLMLNSLFKINVLNISPVKDIVEGKNGWYYRTKYIEPYINERLFNNIELDSFNAIFTYRASWLADKGIKNYFIIVPNKSQIYPEFLPDRYSKSRLTKTDQFIKSTKKIPNFEVFYLKDALLSEKEKSSYNLYYKTDQHWNEYGAVVGLIAIINKIKLDFPELQSIQLSDFNIDTISVEGKGMAKALLQNKSIKELEIKMINKIPKELQYHDTTMYPIPAKFPYKFIHQQFYSTNEKNLPKVLIIRDSFSSILKKQFSRSFSWSTFFWDSWCYELNKSVVENEKPDIFITIIIESNLPYIIYKHPSARKDKLDVIDVI